MPKASRDRSLGTFAQPTASLVRRTTTKITVSVIFVLVALGVVAVVVLDDMDTVTSTYLTRAEAEADKLFERGWLPSLIPSTATNIRVTTDLDLNTSEGSFSFQPSESATFTGILHRLDATSSSSSQLERRHKPGAIAHRYSDGPYEWTFLVSPDSGHCDYYMRPKLAAHTP
jgi:hypothetical protein